MPDLYKTNLKDAQRDLKTTPVDIDGVSLNQNSGKIAEKIAKQNAKTIEEKNSEKTRKKQILRIILS